VLLILLEENSLVSPSLFILLDEISLFASASAASFSAALARNCMSPAPFGVPSGLLR